MTAPYSDSVTVSIFNVGQMIQQEMIDRHKEICFPSKNYKGVKFGMVEKCSETKQPLNNMQPTLDYR